MDNLRDILENLDFGGRTAEEEAEKLSGYFVETDIWRRLISGSVDIIYGPKGSGKSALYSLLINDSPQLVRRGISVIPAENPRGTSAFADVVETPPTSEAEFRALWKMYVYLLLTSKLRDAYQKLKHKEQAEKLVNIAVEAGLLSESLSIGFGKVQRYVHNVFSKTSRVELGWEGKTASIYFNESSGTKNGYHIDKLLADTNACLKDNSILVWIAFDRLDNAFGSNTELEGNALRALFRVYLDTMIYSNVSIKIFLRSDIWKEITKEGFREASHITRTYSISWDEQQLLNLIIKRLLANDSIKSLLVNKREEYLSSIKKQEELFYHFFPLQVDLGEKKKKTFGWLLSRTSDGTRATAPRELIHILNESVLMQLKALDIGKEFPAEGKLFSPAAIKEALPEVSRCRLEQTVFAEYPALKESIQKLNGHKTKQSVDSLRKIWDEDSIEDVAKKADRLCDVGIFEKRAQSFWVPFLYRPALSLVQGDADVDDEE